MLYWYTILVGWWPLNSCSFMCFPPPLPLFLSLRLSDSPSDQTVFTQCRPSQGVLEHVRTCAPALPSKSGHAIIRTSYHFLGSHPSLSSSPPLPSSQFIVSLSPCQSSPFSPRLSLAAHVSVCVCVCVRCVHWCTPYLNSLVWLWSRALFALLCLDVSDRRVDKWD